MKTGSMNLTGGNVPAAASINAFMASPQWSNGAFFLTYDEHGG